MVSAESLTPSFSGRRHWRLSVDFFLLGGEAVREAFELEIHLLEVASDNVPVFRDLQCYNLRMT